MGTISPYYQDSHCTIYHGDCLDILPELPPVDLVLTDPPYGMNLDTDFSKMKNRGGFKGKSGGTTHSEVIGDDAPFDPRPILSAVDCAEQFWFGADYYAAHLPSGGSWMVWDKRLDASADKMFGSCFELIWSMSPRRREILRIKWAGIFGTEKQDVASRVHPTQKPLEVIARLVQESKSTGVILDPFMGSGTTLRAAKDLGRRAIGIEIEEKYCEIAARRLRQEVLPFASEG